MLINRQRKINIDLDYLCNIAGKLTEIIPASIKKIHIVLVSDKKITCLNKKFLGRNYPTDVMTFKSGSTGEIVISVETAGNQAKQMHHSIEKEILYLVIHGILHLSGYNDNTQERYDKMKRTQDRIFFKILTDGSAKRKE